MCTLCVRKTDEAVASCLCVCVCVRVSAVRSQHQMIQENCSAFRIVYADLFLTCNFDKREYGKTSIYSSLTLSWTLAHTRGLLRVGYDLFPFFVSVSDSATRIHGRPRTIYTIFFRKSFKNRNFMRRNFRGGSCSFHDFIVDSIFSLTTVGAIDTGLECVNNR